MPRQVCAPWLEPDQLCCEGETFVEPCDGSDPVEQTYPFCDEDYIMAASNILFARTCSLYPGICTATVWPCVNPCESELYPCAQCCAPNQVRLPVSYPVVPDSVTILEDGVPFTQFRVERNFYIVRTDGSNFRRNSFGIGDGIETTIEYSYGRVPPPELVMAAQELACELKKACSYDGDCRLDPRVRSVARQGLSMDLIDLKQLLSNGKTGLPMVDYALMIHGECSETSFMDPAAGSLGWGPA